MRSVLVSHPHAAAVAKATAAALERDGHLAVFFTGIGATAGTFRARIIRAAARHRPEALNRLIPDISGERLVTLWAVELAARTLARIAPKLMDGDGIRYDTLFGAHDTAVSQLPWPGTVKAVYSYEDGALQTFRRAERQGVTRILDLPTPHWRTAERIRRDESARWPGAVADPVPVEPEWKKKRKDAELGFANVVSVASAFTRRSLEAVECNRPVVVTPYGFPIEQFRPKDRPVDGPFTVLAVGSQDLRKGTPYLLEAWKQAGLKDARLRLVGPMKLTPAFLARYQGLFEHIPHLPRAKLEAEYHAADLLAFPTLGDGFGLVVQEAMCCATPVLTTPCGGGPECITNGEEGWILPSGAVDVLVDYLRLAVTHRDRLLQMGQQARARAERWTWRHAGKALVRAILTAK